MEEEEKHGENGKKEEERGREPEGEREADKTDPSEMGKVDGSQIQEKLCCSPKSIVESLTFAKKHQSCLSQCDFIICFH